MCLFCDFRHFCFITWFYIIVLLLYIIFIVVSVSIRSFYVLRLCTTGGNFFHFVHIKLKLEDCILKAISERESHAYLFDVILSYIGNRDVKKTVQFDRFFVLFCFCFTFEDGSHFTAQTDFLLVLFLIQSPIGFYYAWLRLNYLKIGGSRLSVQLWKRLIGQMECEVKAMNWGTQEDPRLSHLRGGRLFPLSTERVPRVPALWSVSSNVGKFFPGFISCSEERRLGKVKEGFLFVRKLGINKNKNTVFLTQAPYFVVASPEPYLDIATFLLLKDTVWLCSLGWPQAQSSILNLQRSSMRDVYHHDQLRA